MLKHFMLYEKSSFWTLALEKSLVYITV